MATEHRTIIYPEQPATDDRDAIPETVIDFTPGNHRYKISVGGGEAQYRPSVTTIQNEFNSSGKLAALNHWAFYLGWEAAFAIVAKYPNLNLEDKDEVKRVLRAEGLDLYTIQKDSQDRGNAVHAAMELYAKHGTLPSVADAEERDVPYIQGAAAFLLDAQPEFLSSETMVYSHKWDYCGTYDWRAAIKRCMLVVHAESGAKKEFAPGIRLGDYKTGKRIYAEASAQVGGGYEGASIECGLQPTMEQWVVRFTDDGKYEVRKTWSTPEMFGGLVTAYRLLKADREAQAESDKELNALVKAHEAEMAVAA